MRSCLCLLLPLAACLRARPLCARSPAPAVGMFSGIVEDVGEVLGLTLDRQMTLWDGSTGEGAELRVASALAVREAYVGCSIAVNGVCLTATAVDTARGEFSVGLSPETLRRSNLGLLSGGSKVNIERALKADSRNSGHFVQGHVDCVGTVAQRWREGESLWVRVSVPREFIAYVVAKGFIAIDGTSLTVCEVSREESAFTVMLISHTQTSVTLPRKQLGELVNIEVDVLAKMVEQSLRGLNERILNLELTVAALSKK